MNIKPYLAKVLVGAGIAGTIFLGTYKTKIEPIGWHYFNGDGVKEAIVTHPFNSADDPLHEISAINGKQVYRDAEGNYRATFPIKFGTGIYAPLIRRSDWGDNLVAIVRDANGNGNPDLELYASADVEPGFKFRRFDDVR